MNVTAGQVQKVMRGSVWAWRMTSVFVGMVVVGGPILLLTIVGGGFHDRTFHMDPFVFSWALESWSARIYVMLVCLINLALMFTTLLQIRAVFADLAGGRIFCDANVLRIRRIGWLTIAGGVWSWLLPLTNPVYSMLTGHDGLITYRSTSVFSYGLLSFLSGGLTILQSWIMAVGMGVREDAEELRRDAELVI